MFLDIPVKDLTAPVLLGIGILMVLTGLLVPSRFYKAKSEESERWRLAFETEREARMTSDAQTSELLEGQKTSHALIVAIFKNSEAARESGEKRNVVLEQ